MEALSGEKLRVIDVLPAPQSHASSMRAWWRRAYILPSMGICLLVCAWFVTWADWEFFAPESFCRYYDAQALSILHGRLDVPAEAIGFEAFVFEKKFYGYFGIGPAILRLPLVLLLGDLNGLSSRAMMMMACIINVVCAYGILRALRPADANPTRNERVIGSLFILCAGIGSTNVFLMSRSFVFHEATMWAGAFALACAWAVIRYRQAGKTTSLIFASVCALLSFHSRPTSGSGALLMIGWLAILLVRELIADSSRGRPLHTSIALFAVLFTVASYCAVNYAKFRTFESIPLRYYQLYLQSPERMQITAGRQLHVENIATNATNYFGWYGLQLRDAFPWFSLNDEATIIGSPAIDVVEPFSTIPISMPALTLLGFAGSVAFVRDPNVKQARLPAVALWIGGAIVLMTVGITERYLHDFYPALIICAAVGVLRLRLWPRQTLITVALGLLAVVSISLNCAFGLVYQRAAPWGVPPAKRAEFIRWQQFFDR